MSLQLAPAPSDVDELDTGQPAGWVALANCLGVDPELFFPGRGESTKEAKQVCAGCTVRDECLEHAMAVPERFGIWGGLSERERRRHRRQLLIARRSIEMGRR